MNISQLLTKLKTLVYSKSETDSLLGGKASSSHTHTKSQITDFPSLATVATSGSYSDLSNKPTIRNDILHYAAVNSLDADTISEDGIWYVAGAITGAPMQHHGVFLNVKTMGTPFQMYFPDDLLYVYKRIYTSGAWGSWEKMNARSWDDIQSKPTIPTNTNQLINGSGYLSGTVGISNGGTGATTRLEAVKNLTNENVGTSTQYFFTLTENWGKVGYASVAEAKSVLGVPTNTNQLTNGAGFITSSGSCNYANSAGSAQPVFNNGTWYAVGDDAAIGDHNVGGGLGVKALNSTTTRIDLCYKDDASNFKSITYDGTTLYMDGNCNYANSAGSSSIATRDSGGMWISGRDNAVVKQTRHSTDDGQSWNPAVSVKTKNGNWTIGTVGYDQLQFSYDTDANYNAGSNKNIVVSLNPENGRIITSGNTGNISISGYQVYVG